MSTPNEKVNFYSLPGRAVRPAVSIGGLLVESGRITAEDAERVMRLQRKLGLRFGDAAVKLGLIKKADIEQALSRQFEFPYLVPGQSRLSGQLVAAYAPFDPRIEVFRAVRSDLMLRWFKLDLRLKHLAIVSPGRTEGRSYLAANLAVVFSQLGERTLLIDADLRNPRQHVLFGLENRFGLSTLLAGRVGSDAIERIVSLANLSVLPAGPIPPNPQELLGRPAFQKFLAELDKEFDVVILDTPAGEGSADAQVIASRACGALMVVRRNHTLVRAIKSLSACLVGAGATLMGSVINTA
jgi:receptor protein-tyrosine kinase